MHENEPFHGSFSSRCYLLEGNVWLFGFDLCDYFEKLLVHN